METFATKIKEDLLWFFHQKIYMAALIITALCSYGFEIAHPAIGIDDTAVELYLEEGLEVVMGRWTIFLINKLFHLSTFAPFMLELVGVLLFMLGITLFCVLLRLFFGERVSIWGYTLFACLFLSNPIISEVYVYYYHDGSDLAYVFTALALLCFVRAIAPDLTLPAEQLPGAQPLRQSKGFYFVCSMLLAWLAVGCYESFLILYILGMIVIVFLCGMTGRQKLTLPFVGGSLGIGALLCIGCVVLRSCMIRLVTAVFRLQDVQGMLPQRSLSEMLILFRDSEGLRALWMLAKRFWLVYHVNAIVYLPVTGFALATFLVGGLSVYLAVRRRNLWYPLLFVGMLFATFLLTVAEARLTSYRSCQFLPFFTAFGFFLLYAIVTQGIASGKRNAWAGRLVVAAAGILLFNQAEFMNRSFYVDYQKYESTRELLVQIAYEVETQYGTGTPILFVGHYSTPQEYRRYYEVSRDSWQYRLISAITDPVDVHLKEKYHTFAGYSFAGEALNPLIQWGFIAFDGTNRELIRFLEMHGYSFRTVQDPEVIAEAKQIGDTMPGWPAQGSITRQDGYILIHIAD